MADEQPVVVETEKPSEVVVEVAEDKEQPGKPQLSDEEVSKMDVMPADDEIGRYAKDAQKRIKSLYIANQEWRRRMVQSQKDASTATSLAEQLYKENQSLKQNVTRSESALIEQALQRTEAQLAGAKQRAFAAYAANNPAEIIQAQEDVARYVAEADRLRLLRPPTPSKETPSTEASADAPRPQPQPQPQEASPATKAWTQKNPWFGRVGEEEMTAFAMGVHNALVAQGITESSGPSYWGAIDARLREKFPERFTPESSPPKGGGRPMTVTGATRTANGGQPSQRGPRHIVLTESQVRLARALDLTPEQYAQQLIKEEAAGRGTIQ